MSFIPSTQSSIIIINSTLDEPPTIEILEPENNTVFYSPYFEISVKKKGKLIFHQLSFVKFLTLYKRPGSDLTSIPQPVFEAELKAPLLSDLRFGNDGCAARDAEPHKKAWDLPR